MISSPMLRVAAATSAFCAFFSQPTCALNERAIGGSTIYNTRFPGYTWDHDKWVLTKKGYTPGHYQSRTSNANGYLGINVADAGPFFEYEQPANGDVINGWPLFNTRRTFATISGFWDRQATTNGTNYAYLLQYGDESVISGVPHWGALTIVLENGRFLDATVHPSALSNHMTHWDYEQGVLSWSYKWSPRTSQGLSFDIKYSLFASKLHVNEAFVDLQVVPSRDCKVSIVNILDGRSAIRTTFVGSGTDGKSIFSAVSPNGVKNVTAYIYASMAGSNGVDMSSLKQVSDAPYIGKNDSTIAQAVTANLKAGQTTRVTKYVGGATTDGFPNPKAQAKNACAHAMSLGYDTSLKHHVAEWNRILPRHSVDDYTLPSTGKLPNDPALVEKAIVAVVHTFMLLMNTVSQAALDAVKNAPINVNSISVCGLTSDCYGGMVFWDAETWMEPGLVVAHPQAAKQIPNYRVNRYPTAKANAQTAYQTSKNKTRFSNNAAVYSWTSGRYGNCTGTGPCFDYEYHINGDIVLSMIDYWAVTEDMATLQNEHFQVIDSVATFYSEVLEKNGSLYALTNMTDPDEFANNVDNGGFTMPLIAETLRRDNIFRGLLGKTPNATFETQASQIQISKSKEADIILEYTGMNGSINVKQADVVLVTYPLNFRDNYSMTDMLSDFHYYAGKQSQTGPGMTYAIFSIVASKVSPSGCSAYTYDLYSTQPYLRGWLQFSEQLTDDFTTNGGTHPAFPFLTGHGGALQVNVFGYLGLRLEPDFVLHVDPTLPPQIPHLAYRTFFWHGWPIRAVANQTHTTLSRIGGPLATANKKYATTAIPVHIGDATTAKYQLRPGGTVAIPNRQVASIKTVPGNLIQCLPVTSASDYRKGQFALSAIDGDPSTTWQPLLANVPSSLTVDLSSQAIQPITRLFFDWARILPVEADVVFHNATRITNADLSSQIVLKNIKASAPYNKTLANEVLPYTSNTTTFTLPSPVWSGRFVTLTIRGNQDDALANATGATVAEFVVIGSKGQKMMMRGLE